MPRLSIALLGPMIVTLNDQPVSFGYDKLRALLAYLALEAGHPIRREKLAGLLWPDQSNQSAQDSLRQALSRLRQVLGERQSTHPVLLIERETVQMPPSHQVWMDARTFEDALTKSHQHAHRHPQACLPCTQQRRQACALYRGPFLADVSLPDSDLFEGWVATHRARFNQQASEAYTHLIGYDEWKGNETQVRQNALNMLKLDPWNESAHAAWMRLLGRGGQRSEAVHYYQTVRQTLKDELGIEPSPPLAELYAKMKDDTTELLAEFRPRRAAGLPAPLVPLVGRQVELNELQAWLADPARRLITITGPGGVGKSRLMIAAAEQQAAAFRDGAAYISLTGTPDQCEALVETIESTIGINGKLLNFLRNKDYLLCMDGLEYCLPERNLVESWLKACPGLVVLATSRQRLGIPGEWNFGLGGLEVPPPVMTTGAEQYSAVALFVQRAQQANPAFELNAINRPSIGEICRLVDGFPLAINLAAAWTATLPCAKIASEIHRSLDILARQTDSPNIHHSIRAVFDQSWQRLTEEERLAFPSLSVFRGGFDHRAAQAVAGADLKVLTRLVEKCFLRGSPEGRYDLHDLLRQYGAEKLAESGESADARRRHYHYYYQTARQNQLELPRQINFEAFRWLVREHLNLQTALEWALEHEPSEQAEDLERQIHTDFHGYGVHRVQEILAEESEK